MAKKSSSFDVATHILVPKHKVLSDKEKEKFLKQENFKLENLPVIRTTDMAIVNLSPSEGDVVAIERESKTAKSHTYYRRVING